jgi:cardiolipin synthase
MDLYWPDWLRHISIGLAVDLLIALIFVPWILTIKRDSTAAVAWCLVVLLLPLVGALLFVIFGYSRVYRPVRRKRRHHAGFRARHGGSKVGVPPADGTWLGLGGYAARLGASDPVGGNRVTLYHDTHPAFAALFEALEAARHHIHLEFYIVQPDATGKRLIEVLARKAKEGVEVRLLVDALGSFWLSRKLLAPLAAAGGRTAVFLGINLLRQRVQVNLRNHRKIVVIDGRVAFTGGANVGDEYLGLMEAFGYWRDTMLKLEGPAAAALQWIFVEDWDFAAHEPLAGPAYFPAVPPAGDDVVQAIAGGPDQESNAIRDLYFAAITSARERLWIATPYLVPDVGLLDALRFAARRGVDVRILVPLLPDHFLVHFAGRFYFDELLPEGVRIYEYDKGMMHAKVVLVDGRWAAVGSTNLDYRSLRLNFEANCLLHTPARVAELEVAFLRDLRTAIRVGSRAFLNRPLAPRLLEQGCRLLSPIL